MTELPAYISRRRLEKLVALPHLDSQIDIVLLNSRWAASPCMIR